MAPTATPGDTWPPAVKEWVSKCLGAMNDSNRAAASAELKEIIASAYVSKELWTIDWSKRELESLKPSPVLQLKRKNEQQAPSTTPKKQKKAALAASPVVNASKLHERASRFQREHEIERQKQSGAYSSTSGPTFSQHVNPSSPNGSSSFSGPGSTGGTAYHVRRKFLNSSVPGNEPQPTYDVNVMDWDKYTIKGTSDSIFKNYLRLTSEPDPKHIRPLSVLEKTLKALSERWRTDSDYVWTCDQFKSLRQDLTVQRIKNAFTVRVYEIHARMALESSDLVEYNSCQAMLRELYKLGLPGSQAEFMAYQILYLIYIRNKSDLTRLISTLTSKQKQQVFIRQALNVHRALSSNNYHAFFQLFTNAYNMGGYILDHLIERERVNALVIITRAYKQLDLKTIAAELAFEMPTQVVEFLIKNQAAFFIRGTKPSSSPSSSGAASRGPLIQRVDSLSLDEGFVPDEDKILDCKVANGPLVECLASKHSRVGIKGRV